MNLEKKRYELLDTIRGFALLSMILYHLMWDLDYVLGLRFVWFQSTAGYIWQQATCWSFIFLSGFCWKMGRKPVKRGLQVLVGAMAVAAVTWFIMPDRPALFGILTFIAASMLLMVPLEKVFARIPGGIGAVCFIAAFFLTKNISQGYLGFGSRELLKLPPQLYQEGVATFLGFMVRGFSAVDYFPLLPWFFLYAAGYFTYRLMHRRELMGQSFRYRLIPFTFLGQHSLLVYLLHQPVLYAGLTLLQKTDVVTLIASLFKS